MIPLLILVVMAAACNNDKSKENGSEKKDTVLSAAPKADPVKFTIAMVDNAKDPSCGMPVAAGIEDTLHYNNKALGFCSKECKEDFVKNAAKAFATVEWKK
jgi:YHS domain-containing protein